MKPLQILIAGGGIAGLVPGERGHRRYLELTAREVVPVAPLGWEVLVTSCDSLEVPLPAVRERPNLDGIGPSSP